MMDLTNRHLVVIPDGVRSDANHCVIRVNSIRALPTTQVYSAERLGASITATERPVIASVQSASISTKSSPTLTPRTPAGAVSPTVTCLRRDAASPNPRGG